MLSLRRGHSAALVPALSPPAALTPSPSGAAPPPPDQSRLWCPGNPGHWGFGGEASDLHRVGQAGVGVPGKPL